MTLLRLQGQLSNGTARNERGERNVGHLKRNAEDMRALVARYEVSEGADFDLDRYKSDDLPDDVPRKVQAETLLTQGIERLAELQELLYANATWSVLVVIQAMDAAGKDSTIKHVLSGINPQGVDVTSFKAPTSLERAHDFLWRIARRLPARGMIGIFNRSHYEEVLVTRVHPELLEAQKLPKRLVKSQEIFDERIADIAAFEAYLGRQGTRIVKIFLNVGRDEQKARLLARLEDPTKHWKFDPADVRERDLWSGYRAAYQAAIAGTATREAPWYVVPADRKWYARLVVAEAIIAALSDLSLAPPRIDPAQRETFEAARRHLEAS